MADKEFMYQGQPVKAAGVLLYKYKKGRLYFLLSYNRGHFEDLGGHVDKGDEAIPVTMGREASEESNGLITKSSVIKRILNKKAKIVYSPVSKYLIAVMPATLYEAELTKHDFGEYEIHDNVKRTIDWISAQDFFKQTFPKNWRLRVGKDKLTPPKETEFY